MRTTFVIDDQPIVEALKATGLPTDKAVVEAGLRLLVQVQAQYRHTPAARPGGLAGRWG